VSPLSSSSSSLSSSSSSSATSWRSAVWAAVELVPRGRVVSYGDVAAALGHPRRARLVGGALGSLDPAGMRKVPWQRVVNTRGYLSIRGSFVGKETQRALLVAEGVDVDSACFVVDFATHRWSFPANVGRGLRSDPGETSSRRGDGHAAAGLPGLAPDPFAGLNPGKRPVPSP
jgi:methylated-DNA-protein-cysteine methyltransferase-like protein